MEYLKVNRASEFAGTVVVVTGGGSGIGKQIAIDFLKLGARVVICGDHLSKLEKTQTQLKQCGLEVDAFECDVRHNEQVLLLAQYVLGRYEKVDIMINN